MRYRRKVTANDIKTTAREERVAVMTAALLSEEPLTEEEIEESFLDVDPSKAAIYVPALSESSETEDVVGDELRGDAG